jgi:hypothetical protein
MTGRRMVLRLACVLITEACQRLPVDARQDREREWTAELAVIIDDPDLRPRWRGYLRAMRFAGAQSRTVRRLTRPAGLERVRVIMVRTALASAGAAVALAVTAVVLDPVANSASSDSSPVVTAEIWAITLAMAAGLLCAVIMASLSMARVAHSFRPRQQLAGREAEIIKPAWRAARTTRMARAALVGGVLAVTAAAVAGTVSAVVHGPSKVSLVLKVFGSLLAIGGAACLGLAAILAVAAAVARLWHLNRRVQDAVGPGEGPPGPA